MKRSLVINNSNDDNQISNSTKQQRKRPLEDNGPMTKLKKRRHLSPKHNNHIKSSLTVTRTSKKRSSLNNSASGTKNNSHTSRVSLNYLIFV